MLWYTWYEVNTKIPSFNKTKTKPNQTSNKKQRNIIIAVSNYTLIQLACVCTEMCEKILPCTSHAKYNCFKATTEVLKMLRFVFHLFIALKKPPIKFLTPLESFKKIITKSKWCIMVVRILSKLWGIYKNKNTALLWKRIQAEATVLS